jgi:EAL domain-containing protein (putative c-di-GMP-specific phosphodiesterase class I)
MLESLSRPFEFDHRRIYTSASAGICLYPNDGENLEELLRKSDAALSNAKQRGRAQAAVFESGMNAEIEERLHIERELRSAVTGNELRLHFQPSVDLHDGRIVGFEALVRWESPQLGLVPPGKFIPVAEESGLILEIGQWVIEESCRMLHEWENRGLEVGMIAINLSPVQFAHADVLEQFRTVLQKYALHPGQLRVEITEGVLVLEPQWTVQVLEGLQAMGISVALDDFGTGYSSMAYLQQFPIQYLKLDRSFITGMFESDKNAHIVLSVIELAHRLGMAVVAEGIEHAREADKLRGWGCEFAQGYHFSKPLPAEKIPALLQPARPLPDR